MANIIEKDGQRYCSACKTFKDIVEFQTGKRVNGEMYLRKFWCTTCAKKMGEHYRPKNGVVDLKSKVIEASVNDRQRRMDLGLTCWNDCAKYPCFKGQLDKTYNYATTCVQLDEPVWVDIKSKIKTK